VTIHPLFRDAPLGPEEIETLAGAYEDALARLGLKQRSDRITEVVARKALEIWQRGVRGRTALTRLILNDLTGSPLG